MTEGRTTESEAATSRLAVVEALLFVGGNDEIYAAVHRCRTYEAALGYLADLGMTEEQSVAVLAMPLSDRILSSRFRLLEEAASLRERL